MQVDVAIFGGGASGLWLLDELQQQGYSAVLLEARSLGMGQTVGSQGIIHGGLKYTLAGLLTASAASIRDMPHVWRRCLAGEQTPDLRGVRVRSDFCYLWRTDSASSKLGMIGAKFGLRVAPESLDDGKRPAVLANCPGAVARLDEQVISPSSFIAHFTRKHRERILKIDAENGLDFEMRTDGVRSIRLKNPESAEHVIIEPDRIVFAAGSGNDNLRRRSGLPAEIMQRRPLHMVMVRGSLPELNGHCVDGAKTRVTITCDTDSHGNTVWQLGGQIAEDGVAIDERTLVERAYCELTRVVPGIDLSCVEWGTYRVDRAERRTATGKRPESAQVVCENDIITAWPTKLALVPLLTREVRAALRAPTGLATYCQMPPDWPRPDVALPPWETCRNWISIDRTSRRSKAA